MAEKNKIDLRDLAKMAKNFRSYHRVLKKLKDGEEFYVSFYGTRYRSGIEIPLPDEDLVREHLMQSLESAMHDLRIQFSTMGIDPLVIEGRPKKKAPLAVAK